MADSTGEIRDTPGQRPLAYFITFSCYGAWLHGAESGSVDVLHNQPETPFLAANPRRREAKEKHMDQPPFTMDGARRAVVLRTILAVCVHRKWELHAAHVRTNHVHVVVQADAEPEKVMNDLKAYSSRRLSEAGLDGPDRRRWARHGSTRYLWKWGDVADAVHYTLQEQGEIMAAYPTTQSDRVSEPQT